MKIKEYIESGILEAYVLGSASEAETQELMYLKELHPQIQSALYDVEVDIEHIAEYMAIKPPPELWLKIENGINELVRRPAAEQLSVTSHPRKERGGRKKEYIDVDSKSSHMRVHKIWRWILIAIFVLGKVFLGFAIFFYLENRQIKEEISDLKSELKQLKTEIKK